MTFDAGLRSTSGPRTVSYGRILPRRALMPLDTEPGQILPIGRFRTRFDYSMSPNRQ